LTSSICTPVSARLPAAVPAAIYGDARIAIVVELNSGGILVLRIVLTENHG